MQLDLKQLSSSEIYHLLTQTVIPRPIAWILSENSEGASDQYNLAPFSFFNAMASNPPAFIVSIGNKPSGESKDTRTNLAVSAACVVHIASIDQMQQVSDSAATLGYGESELSRLSLSLTEFEGSSLPRLKECAVAFGCQVAQVIDWGETPQALILLEVKHMFVDDSIVSQDEKGRSKIDAMKLQPLARLGANEYASLGRVLKLERPS